VAIQHGSSNGTVTRSSNNAVLVINSVEQEVGVGCRFPGNWEKGEQGKLHRGQPEGSL